MPQLVNVTSRTVADSKSPVGFSTTGGGDWPGWDRYLTVNGKEAYHLGNICGTCSFLFERMAGANAGIEVGDLRTRLAEGLRELAPDAVDALAQLMPVSEYVVALFSLKPQPVQLLGSSDYFAVEQVENEGGVDAFWGLPHYPKVPYYRVEGRSQVKAVHEGYEAAAFDFIVPMFPETFLDQDRIKFYEKVLKEGGAPTAVAVSVLDVKGPAFDGIDHCCLAHYVLDGHHKIAAAARTQRDLTLLAFIAVDHGISSRADVDAIIEAFPR